METGSTTLAFTPLEQHETAITGGKCPLLSTCTADQSSLAKAHMQLFLICRYHLQAGHQRAYNFVRHNIGRFDSAGT
jgi:hypothetical protein